MGESKDRWENINAVQRMQSFIETHLHEPISLHMLAQAAGYSPWHAARLLFPYLNIWNCFSFHVKSIFLTDTPG
jgi:AraC-like DNA-binding protein